MPFVLFISLNKLILNSFLKRLTTSIFFVGTVLGCVYGGPVYLAVLFAVIGFIGLYEFSKLIQAMEGISIRDSMAIPGMGIYFFSAMVFLEFLPQGFMFINLVWLMLVLFSVLWNKSSEPMRLVAYSLFGIVYVIVPCLLVLSFSLFDGYYHPALMTGLLLTIWGHDAGAYLSGMAFGKNKLFERISPKKTWEGSAGGLLSAGIVASVNSIWFPDFPISTWLVFGLIASVAGTLGDLFESLLKRTAGVKDSGSLLPGHGGILDRFDALFASVPFAAFYVYLVHA